MINLFKKKYRAGVGIVLLNQQNQVLVGEKKNKNISFWQLPQGGIEPQETPLAAAKRELWEETGISSYSILMEIPFWIYYKMPVDEKKYFWKNNYIGQKQKWFLMEFTGNDTEINLSAAGPAEFSNWKWIDFKDMTSVAPVFKKESYEKAYGIFKEFLDKR